MNKRGFTLVELLAVIVILSLIAIVVGKSVTKLVKNSREDLYNDQMISIEKSARIWGGENINILPSNGECIYITLNYLEEKGYIDSNIVDIKSNTLISGDLIIKIAGTINEYDKLIIDYEVDADYNEVTDCILIES